MTIKRVQKAAEVRGMYFDGIKKWQNEMVGYGYGLRSPRGYLQADTIQGLYEMVMSFPKVN